MLPVLLNEFVLPRAPEVKLVTRYSTVHSEPFWFVPLGAAESGLLKDGRGGIWKSSRQIGVTDVDQDGQVRWSRLPGTEFEWRQLSDVVQRWYEKPSSKEAVNRMRPKGTLRFASGSSLNRQTSGWLMQCLVDARRDAELANESRRRTIFHLKGDPEDLLESVAGGFTATIGEDLFIRYGQKLDWIYVPQELAFEHCVVR